MGIIEVYEVSAGFYKGVGVLCCRASGVQGKGLKSTVMLQVLASLHR